PRIVQQVASQLASFFIDESTNDRASLAAGTSQFIETQLDDARRRLIEKEQQLQQYRGKFSRQLPTHLESNVQTQANTQMQIRQDVDAINQANERRLMLEGLVKDLEAAAPSGEPGSQPAMSAAGDAVQGGTLVQQLEFAKAQLAQLQKHYTDIQPDVRKMKSIVADLQAKVDADALTRPVSADPVPVSAAEVSRQSKLKEARSQIAELDRQIAAAQADVKRLRTVSDGL